MVGSAVRDAVYDGASLVKSGSPSMLTLTRKIAATLSDGPCDKGRGRGIALVGHECAKAVRF